MANTPQSKKRARQVQKKTEIKKSRRSRIKTFIKLVEENVQTNMFFLREVRPQLMLLIINN